jgi:hypothetical protein
MEEVAAMTTPSSDEPAEALTSPAASGDAAAPPQVYGPPVFAPVPRPPRTPWINPARRGHIVGAAIIAALVLIAGGFGIGYAAAPSGDRHDNPYRMYRGGYGPMMGDPMGGRFVGPGMRGNRNNPFPAPGAPATPATPTPSSS